MSKGSKESEVPGVYRDQKERSVTEVQLGRKATRALRVSKGQKAMLVTEDRLVHKVSKGLKALRGSKVTQANEDHLVSKVIKARKEIGVRKAQSATAVLRDPGESVVWTGLSARPVNSAIEGHKDPRARLDHKVKLDRRVPKGPKAIAETTVSRV